MATATLHMPQYSRFFSRLAKPGERVLLVEYDGTLAPFCAARERALPYPEVPEILGKIASSGTRLIVTSGRTVADLEPLLSVSPRPELWGCDGRERLSPGGVYHIDRASEAAREALTAVNQALAAFGLESLLEVKPGATAIHWREVSGDRAHDLRTLVLRVWWKLEVSRWLVLSEFNGGIEFRVRSTRKADAVRELLNSVNLSATVAYLGGTTSRSEDVFLVLKGRGLGVLVYEQFRRTSADLWLQAPDGLKDFLARWLECSTSGA